jgi:hypothetical protein
MEPLNKLFDPALLLVQSRAVKRGAEHRLQRI